jgi:DNA modification methylase
MLHSFCTVQTIGPAGETSALFPEGRNRLIHGECLGVMEALPAKSFDVIYLDPPFFTQQTRRLLHSVERGASYSDNWDEGMHGYLAWLEERLARARDLLKPEGALFLHLDWHAVHYAKVVLDHLFGMENFQNELVWYYSGGGASKTRFARKHDNILYYTKSAKKWKFYADRVRTPYKWTDGQPRADGSARDYERGKLPDDVWEQHALMPWAEESVAYPTQKPQALLERLLLATTDEGDVVGDFMCGSGTTAITAQRLNRHWVAVDNSRVAVCLAAERLAGLLAPDCLTRGGKRSRAWAQERFTKIEQDESRIGLDAATLTACELTIIPGRGFAVERCGI